jgi:hypothetical protein
MSQVTNHTSRDIQALARKKKIRHYYVKRKKELCEILGVDYRPRKARKTTAVTIRSVENDETTHFSSLAMLAKAMGKNSGLIVWYEKTKRPILVVEGQSEIILPGGYIIDRLSTK